MENTAVRSSAKMKVTIPRVKKCKLFVSDFKKMSDSKLPLKAEEPVRAMPYPIRTAEGVAKAATREGFAATKVDIEAPVPVAEASQSTANLKRKGTWTFKTLAPTRKPKAVMTLKRNSGLSLIHR